MTASADTPNCDIYSLKSNSTWEMLYRSIGSLVGKWVHSSSIPLWHGQEKEVVDDILQETMTKTFTYVSTLSPRSQESSSEISWHSLKKICKFIAYECYQHLSRHDSRFIHIRMPKHLYLGYGIIQEKADPPETVIDNTFQEWCCDHLASEIAAIPAGSRRKRLLRYLANHKRFDLHHSHLLQSAFLKRGIQLRDYQQLRPATLITNQKRLSAMTHKRLMRKQEKPDQKDDITTIHTYNQSIVSDNEYPSESIIEKAETIVLAAELDATAPDAIVDPVFQQTLQNKLLNIQMAHCDAAISVDPVFRKVLCDKLLELLPPREILEEACLTLTPIPDDASETLTEENRETGDNSQRQVPVSDDPAVALCALLYHSSTALINPVS